MKITILRYVFLGVELWCTLIDEVAVKVVSDHYNHFILVLSGFNEQMLLIP